MDGIEIAYTNQARRRRCERNFSEGVDYRHLELATADYFHRIIAIFVVRIDFPVAESQVPLICLATQGVSLRREGH